MISSNLDWEIPYFNYLKSGISQPHNGALVITLLMANCEVQQILINSGSSVNSLFLSTNQQIGIWTELLISSSSFLVGFNRRLLTKKSHGYLMLRFIKAVHNPTWFTNIVMVPKKDGKWHFSVDYIYVYIYIYKAFPLLRIGQLVDMTRVVKDYSLSMHILIITR